MWSQVFEHFFSFGVGLIGGFVLSNKFKIIKRNGDGRDREGK